MVSVHSDRTWTKTFSMFFKRCSLFWYLLGKCFAWMYAYVSHEYKCLQRSEEGIQTPVPRDGIFLNLGFELFQILKFTKCKQQTWWHLAKKARPLFPSKRFCCADLITRQTSTSHPTSAAARLSELTPIDGHSTSDVHKMPTKNNYYQTSHTWIDLGWHFACILQTPNI